MSHPAPEAETSSVTKTTCPYCGVGCGVVAEQTAQGVNIRGDADHPSNFGRLCSKGSALAQTIDLEGRLLEPKIGGKAVSWDLALDTVAEKLRQTIADHGPDSVAFYVSGQLLTEDYYVVNKLAKGFVGTANIDTNSRLCMASSVAGHKRAFGSDTVPGCYEDLEQADLLVLVGSNAAWCHPVLYQRMMAAKAANPAMRMVVIDPRRTDTVEGADLHLPLRSGSDTVLFNGLLAYLEANGKRDTDFVSAHTQGVEAALEIVAGQSIAQTAQICGLSEGAVTLFYEWFARTQKTVTLYSQGVNQSSSGTDKVNAILNCHLLTGRIGKPGMGPFSLTGQPNAMGGREVGGLANQLAVHLDIENSGHRDLVTRFWNAPNVATKAGLKAVEMFQAIAAGKIKAVWIISTNPVVSLPDAQSVRAALAGCEFVVVSDIIEHTDTNAYAHVLLPATAWGEKNGTVTNSERRISRQRSFLPPPGQARPDWQIICDVARRMGFTGFEFASEAEIFAEHAALSGFENEGKRDFDISGLLGQPYESLQPVQWPVPRGQTSGTSRLFSNGGFFAPNRRARFVPTCALAPKGRTSSEFPLVLNTGRVRDHWHTMTRTGKSARLSAHIAEPYAEIHPLDAKHYGLSDAGLARLTTEQGAMIARVKFNIGQRRGCVFVPMHWNEQFASDGAANALVNAITDPISGQPESKHTPLAIAPYAPLWQVTMMTRHAVVPPVGLHWVTGRLGNIWATSFYGDEPLAYKDFALKLLSPDQAEMISYEDRHSSLYRFAVLSGGKLMAALMIGPERFTERDWLAEQFDSIDLSPAQRMSLLAGRPLQKAEDKGAIICSCFSVGSQQISKAIAAGCGSVEALGQKLKAGTNCGSCKPELSRLLREAPVQFRRA